MLHAASRASKCSLPAAGYALHHHVVALLVTVQYCPAVSTIINFDFEHLAGMDRLTSHGARLTGNVPEDLQVGLSS
jgi:hypothetical protein